MSFTLCLALVKFTTPYPRCLNTHKKKYIHFLINKNFLTFSPQHTQHHQLPQMTTKEQVKAQLIEADRRLT